jgi:hypothetical protein
MTFVRAAAAAAVWGAVVVGGLGGCASPAVLTREAIGCSGRDVNILDSRWKDAGSTTTWCASCDSQPGRRWRCTSNAARDRVVCEDARPEDRCR